MTPQPLEVRPRLVRFAPKDLGPFGPGLAHSGLLLVGSEGKAVVAHPRRRTTLASPHPSEVARCRTVRSTWSNKAIS
jgi:hypothetical protein